MKSAKEIFYKIFLFVTHDVWHLNVNVLSKRKAFWIRQLKVLLITIREFTNGKVTVQASSLSFYLLLSIVPIAALVFAVSAGFGIDGQIGKWLTEIFPDQQDVVTKLLELAESAIDNARGGWITGVGIMILLWSSMSMFVRVEEALNEIWQAKVNRSWTRRFADYMSIMLIAPVLLILSNSITVTFRFYLNSVTEQIPFLGTITPWLFTVLVPLILIWILFTFIYMVMPNVKVKFMPALISALIAGTVFYLVEQLYLFSQVTISKYNAIYGSLAAIPLFLLCAKFAWQIVLLGAELSFAYQNIDNYDHKSLDRGNISYRNFTIFAVYVLKNIIMTFKAGEAPKPVSKLSEELGLSVRSLNIVIEALCSCGLTLPVSTENKDNAYVPSMDINRITLEMVLNKISTSGSVMTLDKPNPDMNKITQLIDNIHNNIKKNNPMRIIDL
ncbi:MAG: YihY/virulence factor BrkB family protein [Prevotellaceae bacterium]|jgi:membrane protein|nr:YihY/virulence factor BrkB family protein [Prevotellaceae bacterium]